MATPLLSSQALTKSHSARPLFREISFGIEEGERIGLIGPNGSGKSTLLRILAGLEKPDSGKVAARSSLRIVYVPQEETFPEEQTIRDTLLAAIADDPLDDTERALRLELLLAQMEFTAPEQSVGTLSGGWRKRLALATAAVQEPDLVLLDEPTNHLDLEGVEWLEEYLQKAPFAYLLVSHDRYFLENTARRIIELNPAYAAGYLSAEGTYSDFLVRREEYLAQQAHRQTAMESIVRREIEWLRRGAQARSTKAKGRIDQAGRLMEDLSELKFRNRQPDNTVAGLDFSASGRRTKEMIVAKGVRKSLGGRTLFSNLDATVSPGRRLGIVGRNGSGKTTLLRLLTGTIEPDAGTVKRADGLRIVWFEQDRAAALDRSLTLKDALSPNSDNVQYRGGTMHVSAWAKRFLFGTDQLAQSVGSLSGGEQARVAVARLMLEPADVLILDEPTNDLDIPTLDVLEESLLTFPGAVVLVTHDRYLLDRVSTEILGLMGDGTARLFADYEQYERNRKDSPLRSQTPLAPKKSAPSAPQTPQRPGLTASERRELAQMEERIEKADGAVARWEAALQDPAVASDAARLQEAWTSLEAAREAVNALYTRWEELEAKQNTANAVRA
jgi:ATP-binding cassette subfamily F protein uup